MQRFAHILLSFLLCTKVYSASKSDGVSESFSDPSVAATASIHHLRGVLTRDQLERAWASYEGVSAQRDIKTVRRQIEAFVLGMPELIATAGSEDIRLSLKRLCGELLYRLGSMCFRGEGGCVDTARAHGFYEQAAEYGHTQALKKLGLLFDAGLGVKKDLPRALSYYERDSLVGGVSSAFHKARLLAHLGDPDQAIGIYRKIIEGCPHYTSAFFNLSVLLKEIDSDAAKAYIEEGVEKRYQHMSSLLLYVLENDFAPPPSITYVPPGIHMAEAEAGYRAARDHNEALELGDIEGSIKVLVERNGDLLRQLLQFVKELGAVPLGSMDYFFHDPYAHTYRPQYHNLEGVPPSDVLQGFWRELMDAYEKPKTRSLIYYNDPGKQFLEALVMQSLQTEGPIGGFLQKTLWASKQSLERDPQSLLRVAQIKLRTEDPSFILEKARGFFVSLMIEQLEPFRLYEGADIRPYVPLLVWTALDHLIGQMNYHHVSEGQTVGVSISKLVYQFKRKLLEESSHLLAEASPLEELKRRHGLYVALGSQIGLLATEDLKSISSLIPGEEAVYSQDYSPSVRYFVRKLMSQSSAESPLVEASYTESGLIQLIKRSLFDIYDNNVSGGNLTDFSLVDPELRSLYYHALLMNGKATKYFDPYAEDSQQNGGIYKDPRCLIFADESLKIIINRFGYLET